MLRNRAKRKYGTVAQEIQFSGFYRTAINIRVRARKKLLFMVGQKQKVAPISKKHEHDAFPLSTKGQHVVFV